MGILADSESPEGGLNIPRLQTSGQVSKTLTIETGREKRVTEMRTDISRDSEGYLFQPEDWDETVAKEIASEEGIHLTDSYWPALNFIREYYMEHNIAPDVRHLIAYLASENGLVKKEAKKMVFDLFPYGYVKQACKIAGMRKPRAWSTG